MVGLENLKHINNVSDEQVVQQWVDNPYWQYFCGELYFQHEIPIDPSSLLRFGKRIGKSGCEKLLEESIRTGVNNAVKAKFTLSLPGRVSMMRSNQP